MPPCRAWRPGCYFHKPMASQLLYPKDCWGSGDPIVNVVVDSHPTITIELPLFAFEPEKTLALEANGFGNVTFLFSLDIEPFSLTRPQHI